MCPVNVEETASGVKRAGDRDDSPHKGGVARPIVKSLRWAADDLSNALSTIDPPSSP